ncbi:MAG: sugar transferase, partial [Bacillota bacterium]
PYLVEQLERHIPEYRLRHQVKPGITGLAQVNGYYATNSHDKLRYDLYYLSDYSVLMDLKILLLTIPTLFNREAARGVSNGALKNEAAEKGAVERK